jgi:hypothetical protein
LFDGGSAILDYRVWYDDALGNPFVQLVTLADLNYLATELEKGLVY